MWKYNKKNFTKSCEIHDKSIIDARGDWPKITFFRRAAARKQFNPNIKMTYSIYIDSHPPGNENL